MEFLGHVVSEDGIAPDPAKVEKVTNWPDPTSTNEVQQFLGLASYYCQFIKDSSGMQTVVQTDGERSRISVDCGLSECLLGPQKEAYNCSSLGFPKFFKTFPP